MPQTNRKITALYCRLSQEDMRLGESESIQNQKVILERYAKENHFPNIRFYVDDGVSGVEFDKREGLQRMLDDVEAGNVATVITKDLSRLGRNYLKTGELIEIVFPENNVRYIAISDGVDTAREDNEFMPLRNWFNEFYARDTSKKIRAVKFEKARRGERVNGVTPYGYTADPNDRNHLIPDPEAAVVVQKIFEMFLDGSSMMGIQRWLRDNNILAPAEYRRFKKDSNHILTEHSYDWQILTIEMILQRVEYIGDTITNKSHRLSFKCHRQIYTDNSDQFYFPSTHEPLIDKDVFEQVQIRLQNRIRHKKNSEIDILSGLVFCGECGAKMHSIHSTTGGRMCAYTCGNYRNRRQSRKFKECTAHYIKQEIVLDVLRAELKRILTYVNNNGQKFIAAMSRTNERNAKETLIRKEKELKAAEKRIAELNVLFRKSYEDNALGRISDEQFSFLTGDFDEEKAALEKQINELKKEVELPAELTSNAKKFVTLAKKYAGFTDITYENIHELVERILIHATDVETNTREIEIYFRFVGKIKIKAPQTTYEYGSNRSHGLIRVFVT